MAAGLAGMIGTTMLGARIGFYKNKTPSQNSFEHARIQQTRREEALKVLMKTRDVLLVDFQRVLKQHDIRWQDADQTSSNDQIRKLIASKR